jgi:hypothetical protein
LALQNRVTPFGAILADPARGRFMGNRGGRIHDPATKSIRRAYASKRWIYCLLDFKGRRRKVMGEGYTELFFLDEATAIASGHRPCFECQRERASEFARAFGEARASAIDERLHEERLGERPQIYPRRLPDGAMIAIGDAAYLIAGGRMRRWSFAGYGAPEAPPARASLLTPPSSVAALSRSWTVS